MRLPQQLPQLHSMRQELPGLRELSSLNFRPRHSCTCCRLYFSGYPTLGQPGSTYPAPYATVYRALAAAVVGGTSNLPDHCMTMFGAPCMQACPATAA